MKKALSLLLFLLLLCTLSIPAFAENLALKAKPETSSDYNEDYSGLMAIDGWIKNAETHRPGWHSDSETNPWLKLEWKNAVDISFTALYGIPGEGNSVDKGTIEFSDGSKFEFGALAADGKRTEFDIPAKKGITWVKATIEGTGVVGLDEIMLFDKKGGTNVALNATATASSSQPDSEQDVSWSGTTDVFGPRKAINGFTTADLPAGEREWASAGEAYPSIKLAWDSEQTVTAVVLYDRFNGNDHVLAGELTFSDGSKIEVGELDNFAQPVIIQFPEKKITWVNFEVMDSEGPNLGLAEIEVYDVLPTKLGGPEDHMQTGVSSVTPVETPAVSTDNTAPAPAPKTADAMSLCIAAIALTTAIGFAIKKKSR